MLDRIGPGGICLSPTLRVNYLGSYDPDRFFGGDGFAGLFTVSIMRGRRWLEGTWREVGLILDAYGAAAFVGDIRRDAGAHFTKEYGPDAVRNGAAQGPIAYDGSWDPAAFLFRGRFRGDATAGAFVLFRPSHRLVPPDFDLEALSAHLWDCATKRQ